MLNIANCKLIKASKVFALFSIIFTLLSFASCEKAKVSESLPADTNVLVIVLDTLRADHLGAYGYERNTSPNLDAFAKDNILFEYAIAPAPWTPPAVASIFTGLYPREHGMMPPNSRTLAEGRSAVLSDDHLTLAEKLKDLGYRTSAISSNPWITEDFNYNQGFDGFTYLERAQATIITDRAIRRIKHLRSSSDQPFFLYLHYLDPHDPYRPPGKFAKLFSDQPKPHGNFEYPEKMANFINLYDGEIAYLDSELGKLFNFLKKTDLYKDMLIVIVGDHGEQFLERGDHTHGFQLYNEEVHVPLLLRTGNLPVEKSRIVPVVSLIDIFPTILKLLGHKKLENQRGISLLSSAELSTRTLVSSEIRRKYSQRAVFRNDRKVLIAGVDFNETTTSAEQSDKLWTSEQSQVVGVYDGNSDYVQGQTLQDNELASDLKALLHAEFSSMDTPTLTTQEKNLKPISDEKLEQLRTLGYVN